MIGEFAMSKIGMNLYITTQFKKECFMLGFEIKECNLINIDTSIYHTSSIRLQISNRLIVNRTSSSFDGAKELFTEFFSLFMFLDLLWWDTLKDPLSSFTTIPVNSHSTHFATVDCVNNPSETTDQGFTTHRTICRKSHGIQCLLFKIVGFLGIRIYTNTLNQFILEESVIVSTGHNMNETRN